MKDIGNRVLKKVYLTETEEQYVKLLSKKYGYNFSQMCRYALLHIDDVSAKMKIQVTFEHSDLIAYSGDSRSPIPMISVHSVGDFLYRRQS